MEVEPILVDVPWFKIKSVKSALDTAEIVKKFGLPMVDAEGERVKDVIRKLKGSGKL